MTREELGALRAHPERLTRPIAAALVDALVGVYDATDDTSNGAVWEVADCPSCGHRSMRPFVIGYRTARRIALSKIEQAVLPKPGAGV
jgi:hypothetical protein